LRNRPDKKELHKMRKGIGSHQSANMGKDEWLTPPEIIDALGIFDLDPCAPVCRPWITAAKHYTVVDDGLAQEWAGRVWCNPPYGLEAAAWLAKLAEHGDGIALIFARTKMFFDFVWGKASAVLFLYGRLHFHHVNGDRAKANAGAPSVLVAYGQDNVTALQMSGIQGKLITL
jgi:hypothetical protein